MKKEKHYNQSTRDKFKKNIYLVDIENTRDFDSYLSGFNLLYMSIQRVILLFTINTRYTIRIAP